LTLLCGKSSAGHAPILRIKTTLLQKKLWRKGYSDFNNSDQVLGHMKHVCQKPAVGPAQWVSSAEGAVGGCVPLGQLPALTEPGAALSRVPSATSTPGAEWRRRYLETDELTAANAG